MIEPMVCPSDAVTHWTAITWSVTWFLSHLLRKPLLVISALTLVFGLLGFVPRHSGRRILRIAVSTVAVIYLSVLFPPTIRLAEKALVKPVPSDPGGTADAIVILGRGDSLTPSRVELADRLWQEHRAPLIFASGIYDAPKMVDMLQQQGIPAAALDGEECSRTTFENAKFTAEVLEPRGIRSIILVTDAPHMLRSLLTFRSVGFRVIPATSSALAELNRSDRTSLVLREYFGLFSYGIMGRFFSTHVSQPAPALSQKHATHPQPNLTLV